MVVEPAGVRVTEELFGLTVEELSVAEDVLVRALLLTRAVPFVD